MTATVIPVPFRRANIDRLMNRILEAVYTEAGTVSVAEAVGALEMAKFEIQMREFSQGATDA